MRRVYALLIILILAGCGGSSTVNSSTDGTDSSNESEPIDTSSSDGAKDKLGKAQLGVMSNATVKLYEVEGGEQKLLATEITSRGDSIEDIGNFNLNLGLLEDDKLYLYEVSGGEDYDANDDGEIDSSPTQNLGSFQLIAKGDSLKKAQNIKITIVSAIIYKLVKPYLENSDISSKLLAFTKEVVQEDINGDGIIDMDDILSYDPIVSKTKLFASYQNKIYDMINNILSGKELDFENIINSISYGISYPLTEAGLQDALDHGYFSYVIYQLKNNRGFYTDMSDDAVNMNIAGAYVGISGYTVFDITGAIATGNNNNNSLNGFIHDITEDNNAVDTLENLKEADIYYSKIVDGLNCSDTTDLTTEQKDSCFNLGLVRLTSLSNSVKLLFGGEEELVRDWADGVDINSTDDLNGNSVIDGTDASACAIVYANKPNDNCRDGSMASYLGRVTFNKSGIEHNTTLIRVNVGSRVHGSNTFYKLTTNKKNNNSVVLTNGICDKNFNLTTTNSIDGESYFPCPTLDSNGTVMTIKESLDTSANVQGLFPTGSDTRNTVNGYVENLTGSKDGTINQNNLSDYLQKH